MISVLRDFFRRLRLGVKRITQSSLHNLDKRGRLSYDDHPSAAGQ